MKHTTRGKPEGRLMAAVLGIAALLCLFVWTDRLPRAVVVEPVSFVSAEQLAAPEPAPLDINAADARALESLPGIGAELARRIVEYRNENGPFASLADLDAVPGIGAGRIAALEGLVFCGQMV